MEEVLINGGYSGPVARLLTLGDVAGLQGEWRDYPAMGLGVEQIPDLIRMATDEALHTADSESAEVWAPVHAWRALGQLRAEAAIDPLIGLFRLADDEQDDWVGDDLPEVMSLIGPVTLPALVAYLHDAAHGEWARTIASESVVEIGRCHPEARDACVAALSGQLERFAENGEELNSFLISSLLDLDGVEAAPVMERAFAAGAVDLSVQGDWEEVQIELGLLDKRIRPRPRAGWLTRKIFGMRSPREMTPPPPNTGKSCAKDKKKKKGQRKSRKKNRRK